MLPIFDAFATLRPQLSLKGAPNAIVPAAARIELAQYMAGFRPN